MRPLHSIAWLLGSTVAALCAAMTVTLADASEQDLAAVAMRWSESEKAVLASLSLKRLPPLPPDPSNAVERMPAAAELGRGIASRNWTLIYGGNCVGCMGELAHSARAAGGRVVGITPQSMVDEGIGDQLCDELIVTPGMRERKALMEHRGDAFIALPGGLGTLEE